MSNPVELGFIIECKPWQLESRMFPSKIGGKPAWLSLESLPTQEQLQCGKCEQPMIFLCQLYAPFENENLQNLEENFHRTIFVFVCRNKSCNLRNNSENVKVFRNNLKRDNKFYPFEPPNEAPDPNFNPRNWVELCNLCGNYADKKCSKCKSVFYCSRQHQICDWKNNHKNTCMLGGSQSHYVSNLLYPEWLLVIEPEEDNDKLEVDEESELKKFKQMEKRGEVGTLNDISESELDTHVSSIKYDKTFEKFKYHMKQSEYPDQVVRYQRDGNPLWIAKIPVPSKIPPCEYCGAERVFEYQIMPQMLSILKENDIDWGVIAVYTCKNSCPSENAYKSEFAFKQDVSEDSL